MEMGELYTWINLLMMDNGSMDKDVGMVKKSWLMGLSMRVTLIKI